MDPIYMDKLTVAIKLILYNQLKENSDDSYSHKLVDLVDGLKSTLEVGEIRKFLNTVRQALEDHQKAKQDVDLATAFKLLGVLVADERVIQAENNLVEESFGQIKNFFQLLKDQDKPRYHLQYSFLKCISKLCSTISGGIWLCRNDELLLVIFHLLNESRGFYVQVEAQSIITNLMRNILSDEGIATKLEPYIHQMLLLTSKPHMECLKSLVQEKDLKNLLIEKYKLGTILITKLDFINRNSELLCLHCEILASCLSSREYVEKVTKRLLEYKKLKALISFYNYLLYHQDQTFLQDWTFFTVLPLIADCGNHELIDSIQGDKQVKNLIRKIVSKEDIMHALASIDERSIKMLEERHCLLLVDCLHCFLEQNCTNLKMKKLVSECIRRLNLFWNLSTSQVMVYHSMEIFLQLVDDSKGPEKFEILKSIRGVIDKHKEILDDQIVIEIMTKMTELIEKSTSDQDWEMVDSVSEVITALLMAQENLFTQIYPNFVEIFLNHWNSCYQASNDSNLIASCIPILLHIDLHLPASQLLDHSIIKRQTIPSLFSTYLIDGDYLVRGAVIKAIISFLPHLIAPDSLTNDMFQVFTKFYGIPLSELLLSETDSEILSETLKIWRKIFAQLSSSSDHEFNSNVIKMCFESGVFMSIRTLLKEELVVNSVNIEASATVREFVEQIKSAEIDPKELSSIFEKADKPEFTIPVAIEKPKPIEVAMSKDEAIEDIFKKNTVLPTQDLINNVTQDGEFKVVIKQRREMEDISWEQLWNFLMIHHSLVSDEQSKDQDRLDILDDIIAAQSFDTNISSDCY